MMCQWCDNPADLREDAYDDYCFRCSRYSTFIPSEVLGESHACVWEYTTNPNIPNTYFLKCVNPVRPEKSAEYDTISKKCRKYLSLTKAEYDSDEEKRKLSRKLHSYQFLEETRAHWAKIDKIKEDKQAARRTRLPTITQEDYKDDPQYQAFLKMKEKAKSG